MVTFREFKVGDLFTLTGLKQVKSQKNVVEDDNGIPFVVQSTKNNMVKCHVNRQALLDGGENVYDGNTIVLGVTLPAVSYQEIEFGASQVITARRDDLNPLRGLYIVTAMRKALLPKYSYTNKPGIQKYKDDIIQLPVKPGTDEINYTEDDIDWDYMESYIHDLEQSYIHDLEQSYIHDLDAYLQETGLNDYTLTDDEQALLEHEPMLREFKVGDLFTLTGLKQVKSQKNIVEDDNGIPFVVQSTKHNMVKCHVNRQALLDGGENVYDGNTIILGVTLPAVSYQEIEFGASQVITARRDDLNPLRGLYIVTAMRKALLPKYSYTNKPGIQKYKDDIIQLPVKPGTDESSYTEDDIDWAYMESYIRAMEKQVIADVVDYKDSMITTAKELVYV